MKIQIEIGTDKHKGLIEKEIRYVLTEFSNDDFEVIIPTDFDKYVQEKLNDSRFSSNRTSLNQLVMGKLIGEKTLVFNPILYTEYFNEQIRATYYTHEYHHIINKRRLINIADNLKYKKLISLLNFLFDEYSSNRFAFDKTKKLYKPNQFYKNFFREISNGHFENLSNLEIYSKKFDKMIFDFRSRAISIMQFVEEIEPLIERYSIELVSYYSISDSLGFSQKRANETDMDLINLYRTSYESEVCSFEDKIFLIEKYLKGFGISVENHENGLYYNVFERR